MNNKRIGFDRRLKLDWLDRTIGLCQAQLTPGAVAAHLQEQLAGEIKGAEARSKTIVVLLRLWVNVPERDKRLRDEALQLAAHLEAGERLWLHWGISLLAYPFFRDVASIAGQLGRLQGAVSLSQVERRIVESWGQRTTLHWATQRVVRSFVDWGVLRDTDERGSYTLVPPHQTKSQVLALWLLECALQAHEAEQVSLRELGQLSYTFPFDLLPFIGEIRRSKRFEITRQGLDMEMVAVIAT
ncbi:MAG: hypothetical protein JW850_04310 [Thermoflexales bacterium]|nr:hypothetical protein [Thermoflexales bacterium]